MVKKNSIPYGWRTVTPIGHPLPGTRFIAFKVPLKGAVNQRLTPTQKFTPKDLVSAIKALNVELGLIIDLTYTTRYYEVKDLPKSVHYKKLYTVGLEVPDNTTILQFKKCVRKFLWENAENDKLIGVHCTNGINRTGYLICRYLIDVEGWDPDTAIQAFGEARGHQIDGCVYLADLKTQPMRSNLGMDVWDSDEDVNPPPNSMEESRDWHPNEDFHGSGKRSSLLNDQHPGDDGVLIKDYDYVSDEPVQRRGEFYKHRYSDSVPEERRLRDWDFDDKGPGPRCSFFGDHQCYDLSQEEVDYKLPGTRRRAFHDQQPHSDFHEADAGDDFDFVSKVCRKRRHSVQNHQAYDTFCEQFPSQDFDFVNRSQGQKQRSFHNRHEYQDQLPRRGFNYLSRGGFQRQKPFHRPYSHDEMNLEDFEYTDEVSEHTLGPLHDHSNSDFSEKMPLKRCVNRDFEQRLPSFPKFQKQMQLRDFDFNSGTGPKKYGTDNHRSRSQRLVHPEDSRRIIHPSDEFHYRRQSRFTAYSSRGLSPSCVFQEDGSVDYYRGKNSRDREQHKRSYF
ncbi:uncharacterized protein LOC109443880 [Rhinolophus sinicus]|uniref:uncharacterized protein LOC109443880 n=1 Tax=Rhinolophus sinicus TaxID=89399 RepID=UPI003D7ABE0E